MLSDKQLEANRANAQKSTGPKTPEGKKRSSLNATRHGLSGQVVVLPQEDLEAFKKFTKDLVDSFQPFDANETQLAQLYANCQWRINRASAIEDNMFSLGLMEGAADNLNIDDPQAHNAVSYAKTFRAYADEFTRLTLYSQRLVNQAEKALKALQQCQAERRQRRQSELSSAAVAYKAHQQREVAFDPKQNGFDLTIEEIQVHIRRANAGASSFAAPQPPKPSASRVEPQQKSAA